MTKIDIRSKQLRGGRLVLASKAKSAVEFRQRDAMVRELIKQGESTIIEGLRSRQLDIADVHRVHSLSSTARERGLQGLRVRVTGEGGPTLLQGIDRALAMPRKPRTQKLYRVVADGMLTYFDGARLMADILTPEAQAYLTEGKTTLAGSSWSGGRQNTARMFGSLVWRLAIEDEAERSEHERRAPAITRNIWRAVRAGGLQPARSEYLLPEEWVTLRRAVQGLPSAALLGLGCRAGLRADEARYLRTGLDVDLDRRIVHVRSRSGAWAWSPKSKRSTRDVPIPDDLHAMLSDHAASGYCGRTFFLHTPGYDRPISHTLIIKQTRAAFTSAGIRYGRKKDALTFHSLRHTYASWLTQRGMHPKKVGRLLGDSAEMVLRIYGHLAEDDHDEAVELLNAAVCP